MYGYFRKESSIDVRISASRKEKIIYVISKTLPQGMPCSTGIPITLQEGCPWSRWESGTSWCHGPSRLSLTPVVFPSKCALGLITRKDQSKAGSADTRACGPRGGEVKAGRRACWSASLIYLVSSRIVIVHGDCRWDGLGLKRWLSG